VCISLNASVQRPGLEPQRGLGRWLFRIIKLNVARLRWLLCITKTQRGLGRWLFRITRLNVAGREEMAVWRVEAFRRWLLGLHSMDGLYNGIYIHHSAAVRAQTWVG
jgi:hypothetical protein